MTIFDKNIYYQTSIYYYIIKYIPVPTILFTINCINCLYFRKLLRKYRYNNTYFLYKDIDIYLFLILITVYNFINRNFYKISKNK